MRKIKLNKNKFVLVDDEDFEYLNQWKWYFNSHGYAVRSQRYGPRCEGKQNTIYMHKVIHRVPSGFDAEHRNGVRLDNQKNNLRTATRSQNLGNQKIREGGTSRFKGVSWNKENNKWIAQIGENGKRKYLGYFISEEDAARAYDNAAVKKFGDFAYLNFEEAVG